MGKICIPQGNLENKTYFRKKNAPFSFLRHFHFRNWRAQFGYILANELKFYSKSA